MNINKLIQKIESGTYLTEDEIDTLFYQLELVTTYYNRKHAKTILKFNDKYICIEWILGAEWEPPTYTAQPYFVEPKTYTKTITITDWIKCPTRGVIKN